MGLFPNVEWRPHEFETVAREMIVLYTDGIIQPQLSTTEKEYKSTVWLENLVKENSIMELSQLCDLIIDTAESNDQSDELADDQTVVIIRSRF